MYTLPRRSRLFTILLAAAAILFIWRFEKIRPFTVSAAAQKPPTIAFPGEKHLTNFRQITFGGQNAEAYFSADDKQLIFQHQGQFYDPKTKALLDQNVPCDQMYTIALQPGAVV